jgi:hypothetical protein
MRIFWAILIAAFAMTALPVSQAAAKDKAGHCGTMKYFDKKAKKCVSATKEKKDDKKKDKKGKKKKK